MSVKDLFKLVSNRLGLFAAFHRLANAETLTAVMFHRVLPAERLGEADPLYTVSDTLLRQCLLYFRRHYAVIGLNDLLAAQSGERRLPRRALLVTFDDGWDDNFEFALPVLTEEGVPAVVFVATEPLTDDRPWWWQEVLLGALRDGRADYATLWALAPGTPAEPPASPDPLALLARFAAWPGRDAALARYVSPGSSRHMLTPTRLAQLAAGGFGVGSHGATHLPLTLVADAAAEIEQSRRTLDGILSTGACSSLSFPHGRHSPQVIEACLAAGLSFVFTSDAVLNRVVGGRAAPVLGRIEMPADKIADARGRLQSRRMATWLFLRPRRRLGADFDHGSSGPDGRPSILPWGQQPA